MTADFRKYACVEQSIADHSAYLLGAMNGKKKRYVGLTGEKDYGKRPDASHGWMSAAEGTGLS